MAQEWDPNFYKTSYEGFELLEAFPTTKALEDYRQHLLEKTTPQTDFIAQQFGNRPLRVIEFGSGNGRLLVSLALRRLVAYGLGVDISKSRTAFARHWIDDWNLSSIDVVAADALTFDGFGRGEFDLAVCITGAFGYLRAIGPDAPGAVLSKMHRALRRGGAALFELYQLPERKRQILNLNGGRLRTWLPLPPEDRFAYYLEEFEYRHTMNAIRHSKTFIGRDGCIDAGREEILTYYSSSAFARLLEENEFITPRFWAGFDQTPFREDESDVLLVSAQSVK